MARLREGVRWSPSVLTMYSTDLVAPQDWATWCFAVFAAEQSAHAAAQGSTRSTARVAGGVLRFNQHVARLQDDRACDFGGLLASAI